MTVVPIAQVDFLIVHQHGTPLDIGAAEIDREHRQRGYRRIGYHFVVRKDGTVETGRPEHEPGLHARGYDRRSLGIALVGSSEDRTPDQEAALDTLIAGLSQRYPDAQVLHWETP